MAKRMNNHVSSLKLSKRLKKAGVEQESEFYWHERLKIGDWDLMWAIGGSMINQDGVRYEASDNTVSAFLASELLEMLPLNIKHADFEASAQYDFYIKRSDNSPYKHIEEPYTWHLSYRCYRKAANSFTAKNKSLPEAAGELLIWVKENDYGTPHE